MSDTFRGFINRSFQLEFTVWQAGFVIVVFSLCIWRLYRQCGWYKKQITRYNNPEIRHCIGRLQSMGANLGDAPQLDPAYKQRLNEIVSDLEKASGQDLSRYRHIELRKNYRDGPSYCDRHELTEAIDGVLKFFEGC